MSEWQPIETAPTQAVVSDGIWWGQAGKVSDGSWHMWNSFFSRHDGDDRKPRPNTIHATHWQSLPEPPA